ncbi:hypothetical protein [Shewanella xiamenensis]|uniref:hypothetical protein n=1 Tax=Shewanella xiamenensis TaxID=332186 RepID=UPI000DB5B46B|nr:hypothetical protein [Shewanella xiamenensis]MCT8865141.1 hypothetical protein [Shewanella xiamenensis]MCT8877896.1 hypothetical protein [Shewanella xiamenensis]PZP37352.1 MAG: hypothetical protein DI594_03550 [Shewanella oneidensis]
MLDAICVLTTEAAAEQASSLLRLNPHAQAGVTYSVFKFQQLPEAEIERLRQHLYCPACYGKAYFRKASKDGKAACFGSRYHELDCIEFNPSAQKSREEQDALEVQQQLLDADALVIDFSLNPSNKRPSNSAHKINAPQEQEVVAKSEIENDTEQLESVQEPKADYQVAADKPEIAITAKRTPSQGLEKLLHSLLRGSDLATSDLWVYTDDERKYRWRAKNLFVNFADADPTDNKPHMYWGTISHSDPALCWLNPADSKDIGIPIEAVKTKLFKRFNIEDKRDLEGAGLILFGKCFWNKDKTRKIIQLWDNDLRRIFISTLDD